MKLKLQKVKLTKESNWVSVYESTDEISAQLIRLKLEDENIEVRVFNQKDSMYNAFGYIYLHVRKEDEENAKGLITLANNE